MSIRTRVLFVSVTAISSLSGCGLKTGTPPCGRLSSVQLASDAQNTANICECPSNLADPAYSDPLNNCCHRCSGQCADKQVHADGSREVCVALPGTGGSVGTGGTSGTGGSSTGGSNGQGQMPPSRTGVAVDSIIPIPDAQPDGCVPFKVQYRYVNLGTADLPASSMQETPIFTLEEEDFNHRVVLAATAPWPALPAAAHGTPWQLQQIDVPAISPKEEPNAPICTSSDEYAVKINGPTLSTVNANDNFRFFWVGGRPLSDAQYGVFGECDPGNCPW